MDYLRFLGAWYNLPFIGMAVAGLAACLLRRPAPHDVRRSAPLLMFTAGIAGLTLNGAIHDFRLGSFARRFPIVLAASLALGWGAAALAARVRRRLFPPVTGVTFNRPGLEGREVIVLSAAIARGGTGKARFRDEEGAVHVVRVHVPDGSGAAVRFGSSGRLGPFDAARDGYRLDSA